MNRLVILFIFLFALPTAAQERHPLLDLLALVPDSEPGLCDTMFYQDFRAVENARDYLSRPESSEAFFASDPWLGFTRRWIGAPQVEVRFPRLAEAMPATVGFDFFDIDRTLSFDCLHETVTFWDGNFDLDAIAEAHQARGFQQTEIGGVPAWCGAEGCASGTVEDSANVETGNIFDYERGRQVPFLTLPGTLVSSPAFDLLEAIAHTSTGNATSLLDSPRYRTLAEAITDPAAYEGELVSAIFIDPTDGNSQVNLVIDLDRPNTLRALMPTASVRQLEEMAANRELPEFVANYGDLPVYQFVALADRQEGDQQIAMIALLYKTEQNAEVAAPELAQRIQTYSNANLTRRTEPLIDLFPSASVESRVVVNSETGFSVAMVEVIYPTPSPEEEQAPPPLIGGGPPRTPAAYYRFLFEAVRAGFFYPLWHIVR